MGKIDIEELLKADVYSKTDLNNQVRPQISPVDYYRLSNMEFNWAILNPMSIAVRKYREANNIDLAESVNIISPEQKLLYFWWYLDGQVTNGGFRQFISNGYANYFQPILNGLKLLPDKKYYNLVEKVYVYFLQQKAHVMNESPEYFSDSFLSDMDSEYFKIGEQLYKDVELFIRNNQTQFIQPIEKNYSGLVDYRANDFYETLEVSNGVANGKYYKYHKDVLIEEFIYKNGEILVEKKFKDTLLFEQIEIVDDEKRVTVFYPNGNVCSLNKNAAVGYDHRFSIETFYENGSRQKEIWMDDAKVKHIKSYFDDGSLESYNTHQW